MGTWVLNGTTVKLQDNSTTVDIGADTTPPNIKLEVTGTARLPLQDKGGEVYNVKAYGAVGDGINDDRPSIQAAVDAAQGADMGIVYFPPGRYLVKDNVGQPDLIAFTRPMQFLGAGPFLSIITTNQPAKNIFHATITVTDLNDKVRPIIFRDLKFEAAVVRNADAAIRQDVAAGSVFAHGIRIENCHFKGQWIGVQLRGASGAVIENCTFWQSIPGTSPMTEADIWIDEQVGGDSTTHLITGCLFGDSTGTAGKAIKITGKSGGDRIIGNLFAYYDTAIHFEIDGGGGPTPTAGSAYIVQGNVMEGARTAAIRMTGPNRQSNSVISGNTIKSGVGRCVWAEPKGSTAFTGLITVVGNKFAGDPGDATGIELNPTQGATTDRWLITENLFLGFTTAVKLGAGVTGAMLGNNAYVSNATNLVDSSTGGRGATFLDRMGIGVENSVAPTKDLHVKSVQAARPRIYLEGTAGTSSPGVEFAFDNTNTRRAAIIGTAAGTDGVQLELFTKPNGIGVVQRMILDKDGNAIWTSANFQEMIEVSADPAAPATNKARLFMRDNGSGKTQFCVRFATGAVQVIATQP
jgi:hypothetical protein